MRLSSFRLRPPGTYWLTLTNAPPTSSSFWWAVSNGPSVAYVSEYGNVNGIQCPGSNSDSFQIYGNIVPEPSTRTLVSMALLGIGVVYLRRRLESTLCPHGRPKKHENGS